MDTTYRLNVGFKPAMKQFADLDGPQLPADTRMGNLFSDRK
jgi:hypothetical protein